MRDDSDKNKKARTLIDSILEVMVAEGKISKDQIPSLKEHYYKGFSIDK